MNSHDAPWEVAEGMTHNGLVGTLLESGERHVEQNRPFGIGTVAGWAGVCLDIAEVSL